MDSFFGFIVFSVVLLFLIYYVRYNIFDPNSSHAKVLKNVSLLGKNFAFGVLLLVYTLFSWTMVQFNKDLTEVIDSKIKQDQTFTLSKATLEFLDFLYTFMWWVYSFILVIYSVLFVSKLYHIIYTELVQEMSTSQQTTTKSTTKPTTKLGTQELRKR